MWKARISLAKDAREEVLKDGDKAVENYEGKIDAATGCKDTSTLNLVYVDMKQSIPEYYSQNPKLFVDPDEPGAEEDAERAELALNILWPKRQMKPLMRDAIKSTKFYGVCGFKTYFNFKKGAVKDEWNDRIENDDVRTDRVPRKFLLKDPSATCWDTSCWIGHEIIAKVSDIAERFNIKDNKDITVTKSDTGSSDLDGYEDIEAIKGDFQYGTYYEIEDRKKGEVFTIVDGLDKFAKKPTKKSYKYDSMWDFLEYNDIPDRPNTKGDYFFWRAQLEEVAIFRTMLINHAKKGNAKYACYGDLSPAQKLQLKSNEDSTCVDLSPTQKVDPIVHSGIDQQVFMADQSVRADIQVLSKGPRQSAGKKTATEVNATEAAAQQVSGENLERLEEVIASIANKWVSLMQDNYSNTRTVALTGMPDYKFQDYQDRLGESMDGSSKHPFLKFTKGDIGKKLNVRIKAGSTTPDSDQTRMAKFQGFMKFVSTGKLMAGVDLEEVLKEAVEVFDVRNDNLTMGKDNPMEESRLLNAGAYIAPKINEQHDKHLQIHEMESNGNNENILHILGHKMFKAQMDANQMAESATTPPKMPQTGQSFVGADQQQPVALPPQGQPVQQGPSGPPQTAPIGAGGIR